MFLFGWKDIQSVILIQFNSISPFRWGVPRRGPRGIFWWWYGAREREKKKTSREREILPVNAMIRWEHFGATTTNKLKKKVLIKRQNKPAIFHALKLAAARSETTLSAQRINKGLKKGFSDGWIKIRLSNKELVFLKDTSKKFKEKQPLSPRRTMLQKLKNTRERRDTKGSPEVFFILLPSESLSRVTRATIFFFLFLLYFI